MTAPAIRTGIGGWVYPEWRGGAFYPPGLAQKRELEWASRQLGAIEINATYHRLQKPQSFRNWRDQTPEGFVFSVKGPRYVTHMLKLRDAEQPLANFYASGVLALDERLGPFLWQFPPFMAFDEDRFRAFLDLLPRDTHELARVARGHDDFLRGRLEEQRIAFHVSDGALQQLARSDYDPVFGARPLKRAIQQQLENPLAQRILAGDFASGDLVRVDAEGGKLAFSRG